MSAANFIVGKIGSCEARTLVLDSIEQVGVLIFMILNTPSNQVRTMRDESAAEINSLLVDSSNCNLGVLRTYSCH